MARFLAPWFFVQITSAKRQALANVLMHIGEHMHWSASTLAAGFAVGSVAVDPGPEAPSSSSSGAPESDLPISLENVPTPSELQEMFRQVTPYELQEDAVDRFRKGAPTNIARIRPLSVFVPDGGAGLRRHLEWLNRNDDGSEKGKKEPFDRVLKRSREGSERGVWYGFHGSDFETEILASGGLAPTSGALGRAVYLAESPAKADQYCGKDAFRGTMFLVERRLPEKEADLFLGSHWSSYQKHLSDMLASGFSLDEIRAADVVYMPKQVSSDRRYPELALKSHLSESLKETSRSLLPLWLGRLLDFALWLGCVETLLPFAGQKGDSDAMPSRIVAMIEYERLYE